MRHAKTEKAAELAAGGLYAVQPAARHGPGGGPGPGSGRGHDHLHRLGRTCSVWAEAPT